MLSKNKWRDEVGEAVCAINENENLCCSCWVKKQMHKVILFCLDCNLFKLMLLKSNRSGRFFFTKSFLTFNFNLCCFLVRLKFEWKALWFTSCESQQNIPLFRLFDHSNLFYALESIAFIFCLVWNRCHSSAHWNVAQRLVNGVINPMQFLANENCDSFIANRGDDSIFFAL